MPKSLKQLKTCKQGHTFYKSSSCPTCPKCEAANLPAGKAGPPVASFMTTMSAPAKRALINNGVTTLKHLCNYTENEILSWHGIGKTTIPILKKEMKKNKLSFKIDKTKITVSKKNNEIKLETNNSEAVSEYINKLEPEFAKLLNALRKLILSTDKEIAEHIKWNSPSFFYSGKMKEFNAKEYKRDLVVINTRKGVALLIFPTGSIVNDKTGLLEGNYTDGRRMATFINLNDVKTKGKDLQTVIKVWLKLIDK